MWEDIFGGQAKVCWRCSTEQAKDMGREDSLHFDLDGLVWMGITSPPPNESRQLLDQLLVVSIPKLIRSATSVQWMFGWLIG